MRYQISNFELLKELLKSVPSDDSCMEWPRSKVAFGYGQIKFKDGCRAVHRVAYELAVGPVGAGFFALHRCDNPACFRPSHLFLGTKLDNSRDCAKKGRERHTRGEACRTAKLNEGQVREILTLSSAGLSQGRIATRFGINQTGVSRIVLRQAWKHVSI